MRRYFFGIQILTAVRAVFPKDEKVFTDTELKQNIYRLQLISRGWCTTLCNREVCSLGDNIAVIGPSGRGCGQFYILQIVFLAERLRGPY